MGLLWGFGVLLATWGCLGSWAQTRSAPLEQRGSGSRAQGAGGRARQRWDKLACHWPVTPRILEGNRTLKEAELGQEEFPAQLQIALEVEGENLLLDLVQNWELLAGTQGLVYYLPNGTRATHRTSTERNCCYRGSVQGYMDSWANVCVCSGLSGLLVLSTDRSYILESSTEGTKAYRPQGVRQETGECRPFSLPRHRLHSQPELDHSPFHRAKREAEPQVKQAKVESYHGYVELVIVADHAEFQLDPDVNRIHIRMLEIASHMDGFYRTLGLRVAVVGREVWSHEDAVSVDGPPRAVLERFLKWRQQELLPRIPHDSAQLIMGSPFTGGLIGTATQGSICSRRSGGVSMDHSVSPLVMASTLSHQLGHNLGLDHDGPDCGCDGSSPILPPGRSCIMESPTGLTPGLSFSHCSHQRLQQILQSSRVWCLKDVPSPDRLVESRCGNYLVEPKEQCDCGLQEECLDPCCNASTCQLKPGAECATGGACCHECKLRTAGFPCREPQNECDLPEFCSGASPHCPSNLHKQDGTPCRGGEVICYGGTCPLYSSQCQELWGPGSVPVSEACTASLNSRGDLEGHCGQRANGSYIPCSQRDVLCGRLQCQGGSGNTRNQRKTASTPACPHNTPAPTDDLLDLAMVWPGTACGPSKVCLEQRCQDLSALKIPVCQCNGHGVCNNQGNCHCQPGWAPPDCLSSGAGGSVDGGSPTIEQAGRGASTALVLSSLFLVLLLGVGLCWAKRVGLHKRLCQFGKGTSCQYRITHPEPGCYSHAPPERPQPPRWRQNTELQIMPSSKPAPLGATRPNPPSKPLPPDPTPKGQQALVQDRPAPPTRPLPADPIPKDTQPPGPAKPPPPRKPLPSDPPRTELCAVPNYDPRVLMLPARPAPPPPPTCSTAGFSAQVQEI
ncbi:disintegrin and metalloproteinase domain-containing protein 15 isoform X3 [Hemicordylus capensis]|uniref:disintegrin and metalloproteinase domain-containing protein 15 isoform X3 n=1 Tax=Hemicordylus capensis TaxID=884348 RepID=UPI002304049C|nr:disintegrin and metalloproteinase domain-containing protein 15 isoform X3 [Hemicordylus capensis]